jgi:hypothetical protein
VQPGATDVPTKTVPPEDNPPVVVPPGGDTGNGLGLLGLVGLVLLGTAALPWVPFVSGVLSGVTLLGGSLYGVRRAR